MKNRAGMVAVVVAFLVLFFFVVSGRNEKESEAAMSASRALAKPRVQYVEGELLVKMKEYMPQGAVYMAHARVGAQVKKEFGGLWGLALVKLPAGMTVEEGIEKYKGNEDVLYAEPNYIYHAALEPDDPYFVNMWGLNNTGQLVGSTADADIDAPEAWDITTGDANIVIGVIDSGIDYTHSDLMGNIWTNAVELGGTTGVDDDGNGYIDDIYGINAVTWDGNPANSVGDPFDDYDHGTHVAGTIGAVTDNTTGVAGVNWDVQLMALKFLGSSGSGLTSDAVECLAYVADAVDNGVNIIATNNSWGGGGYSMALRDAIDLNRQKGVLFIAAAGNDSADNDTAYSLPASYFLPNIISVAATDFNDALTSFSNIGRTTVHLSAPGEAIWSTIPSGYYKGFMGTSMAAPHVTGVAGLLKADDPSLTWDQIKNLILSGGDDKSALSTTTATGKRLNAYGALTCSGTTLLKRLRPAGSHVYTILGRTLTLAAQNIICDAPAGNVSVMVNPGGTTLTLLDEANSLYQVAGDGICTLDWAPPNEGDFTLTFPGGDSVMVTVQFSSNPFIYTDAGPDQNTVALTTVTLDGSDSFVVGPESQPDFIFFDWAQIGGASFISLQGADTPTPTFTAPPTEDVLEFVLWVFDLYGNSAYDTVTVRVSSAGGGGGGGSPCFIATAAYGSEDAREVVLLRQFRDRYLLTNLPGRVFVRLYYGCSPPLASFISTRPALRKAVAIGLAPAVAFARIALATTALEKVLIGAAFTLVFVGLLGLLRVNHRRALRQSNAG